MVTLDTLREKYILSEDFPDLRTGRRSDITFACETAAAFYSLKMNPDGLEPIEYLDFARVDILEGTSRAAINSLSNAKRAIHLAIEKYLDFLGLGNYAKKTNFPEKLNILQDLGAFPIRMIDALNKKRNLVEHDFVDIDIDEAKDFLDITEMFLLIVYPFFKHLVVGAYLGLEGNDQCYLWYLLSRSRIIQVYEVIGAPYIETDFGKVYYNFEMFTGKENDNYNLSEEIKISKANSEKWLPKLDLLIYLTKVASTRLPWDSRGHGLSVEYSGGTFF
jgi:hypothetical protein